MNLNATPQTVRAVTQVLKLAGLLDDRVAQNDKARIAAWSEQCERHRLSEGDMLDGVQAFYDSPSDRAIQVGDLIHHARIAKRDRLDREEESALEARRAITDLKAADEFKALTAEAIIGRTKHKTPRLVAAEDALQNCHGKRECEAAIREYFAAKAEAHQKVSSVALTVPEKIAAARRALDSQGRKP